VNNTCFIIALVTAIFAIIYDGYLKKIKLLGNFYIAYVMAIPFVFGAAAVQSNMSLFFEIDPAVYIIALIAFLAGSGREIMKDVMDFKGDIEEGVKSFPSYIGIKKSNIVSSIFYFLAVCLSIIPFLNSVYGIYYQNYVYLGLVIITDILFLITISQLLFNDKIVMKKYRKLTLIAIFFGLLAFLIGALIG